ncbi:ribulose-bisphosphate carboxylase [Fischerella sp. NIES-4106]|jgi:2,3-diketo-5-methylthiopentyl-1-phosphate enolase|nr:ribulose-bisphosphate carboxylase [Fischerella sp. NIES-4106]
MTIEVDYHFPEGVDPHKQAKVIAVGQTVGTWDAGFAHKEATLRSHLAQK